MPPHVTLIGLGNILMRDEGAGVQAIQYFQAHFTLPADLEVVDGGTAGLDLLPYIEAREAVIFVDAVNFDREPGYIGVLTDEQIPALFGVKDSLHHTGLMDVLAAARLLDKLPRHTALIGIQPLTIATGLELSDLIRRRLGALADHIAAQLKIWGIGCHRRAQSTARLF